MIISDLWRRLQKRAQLSLSRALYKRPLNIGSKGPFISFSFDDFPRSAFLSGGAILKDNGVRGTYYASLGLMGRKTDVGQVFVSDDLKELVAQGHELGCHTFDHLHPWKTRPDVFEDSVSQNKRALKELIAEVELRTFSYPFQYPRPQTKRRIGRHFACCRRGGQRFNAGMADSNLLFGYFLEKSRESFESVRDIIDRNRHAGGWLIFATHDISDSPTPYGCRPAFFEKIVRYSVASGAKILPVCKVWDGICEDLSRCKE
jgi:peptidoglycan/xylan/chitin deacetylase (PgdA/CDA1 family)